MGGNVSKFIFPIVLTAIGLVLIITSFAADQNAWFILAAFAMFITGAIATLNALDMIGTSIKVVISVVLSVIAAGLVYADYKSIKDPIDFLAEKEYRYEHVIQRLKDIRRAQMSYRSAKGYYAGSADTLMQFITNDSILVVKAIGTPPDTMTEAEALEAGIISRDTNFVPALETIYDEEYLADRKLPLNLDSLFFVPFAGDVQFGVTATQIEKGKLLVPVFEVKDMNPFDPKDTLRVGSLTEPSTNGNWE